MNLRACLILGGLLAIAPAAAAEMGLYGWGPRLGVADDPDQVLIGLHQDFGEFVPRVRFQPNLEVGFGDDRTILSFTIPVHYRFGGSAAATPYAGGGLLVAVVDFDDDGSDLEIQPVAVGGVEWKVGETTDLLLELHLSSGDAHDAKLLIGWIFRAR